MSVVIGMLVKIVPFLAYLNLQQSASSCLEAMMNLPSMHDIQTPELSRKLFKTYCLSFPFLFFIPWIHEASYGFALILVLVFSHILLIECRTWVSYKHYNTKLEALITQHANS